MDTGASLFVSLIQPEADGQGRVDRAHRVLVEPSHALAQAGLVERAYLLEQDDAVAVEPDALPTTGLRSA